jgi:hypothetical protein
MKKNLLIIFILCQYFLLNAQNIGIYWIKKSTNKIQFADLDDINIQTLIINSLQTLIK